MPNEQLKEEALKQILEAIKRIVSATMTADNSKQVKDLAEAHWLLSRD